MGHIAPQHQNHFSKTKTPKITHLTSLSLSLSSRAKHHLSLPLTFHFSPWFLKLLSYQLKTFQAVWSPYTRSQVIHLSKSFTWIFSPTLLSSILGVSCSKNTKAVFNVLMHYFLSLHGLICVKGDFYMKI